MCVLGQNMLETLLFWSGEADDGFSAFGITCGFVL